MDFARKQLERMGWSEGKGLGVNENGITKAIKPSVQLTSRGLGFSVADSIQIKNQWWSEAYNSASQGLKHDYRITSVGVVIKPKKVKKSTDSDDPEDKTETNYNSRFKSAGYLERYEDKLAEEDAGEEIVEDCDHEEKPKKKKKKKKDKKRQLEEDVEEEAVHETLIEQVEFEKAEDTEESTNKRTKKLGHIDFNEIFKKAEGMTCHKAARHGINMTGKMKRLEEQEAEFLKKFKAR